MCRGRPDLARRALGPAREPEPRDELLAAALAVALARRTEDQTALAAAWGRARDALVRHPVDLTTLPQLGELAVATRALGEEGWLAAHLDEADELLDRLGRPALWSRAAALVPAAGGARRGPRRRGGRVRGGADRNAEQPVRRGARRGRRLLGDVLAGAGRRRRHRRRRAADVGGGAGLGGRAADGRAAALAGDRRVTAGLHAAARALHGDGAPDAGAGIAVLTADGDEPAGRSSPDGPDGAGFTERELEIGRHILAGLTYKQIGQRLYLSAKTVEHHVARMRQRRGVASRDELFGLLRAALDAEQPG